MSNDQQKSNFWTTLPGILTGIAAVITAIGSFTVFQSREDSPPKSDSGENARILERSSKINVPADSKHGVTYTNEEHRRETIEFTATGQWVAIPKEIDDPKLQSAKGYLSAAGASDFDSNRYEMPCFNFPLGALVILNQNDQCLASGTKGDFSLDRGETVYFLMNDVMGLYDDNFGEITVKLSLQ